MKSAPEWVDEFVRTGRIQHTGQLEDMIRQVQQDARNDIPTVMQGKEMSKQEKRTEQEKWQEKEHQKIAEHVAFLEKKEKDWHRTLIASVVYNTLRPVPQPTSKICDTEKTIKYCFDRADEWIEYGQKYLK